MPSGTLQVHKYWDWAEPRAMAVMIMTRKSLHLNTNGTLARWSTVHKYAETHKLCEKIWYSKFEGKNSDLHSKQMFTKYYFWPNLQIKVTQSYTGIKTLNSLYSHNGEVTLMHTVTKLCIHRNNARPPPGHFISSYMELKPVGCTCVAS